MINISQLLIGTKLFKSSYTGISTNLPTKNDGANGLINVRMDSRGNMLHISGIAVKFEQAGLSEKIDLSGN